MLAVYLALSVPMSACATSPNWVYAAPSPATVGQRNTIRLDGKKITFNGAIASNKVLRLYFREFNRVKPRPLLIVDTRDMECPTIEHLQSAMAEAGGCPPDACFAYEMPYRVPPPAPPFPPKRR